MGAHGMHRPPSLFPLAPWPCPSRPSLPLPDRCYAALNSDNLRSLRFPHVPQVGGGCAGLALPLCLAVLLLPPGAALLMFHTAAGTGVRAYQQAVANGQMVWAQKGRMGCPVHATDPIPPFFSPQSAHTSTRSK